MAQLTLDEKAAYGKLAFDCFVLERWEYSRDPTEDQQQWDQLARQWLALDPRARHPFRVTSYSLEGAAGGDPPLPSEMQITRALAPHQTPQERNLALDAHLGQSSPVWLRTCYDPALSEAYQELATALKGGAVVPFGHVLDDEGLYGVFHSDWRGVLLRIPSLPDAVQYVGDPDDAEEIPEDEWEMPDEDFKVPVYEAQKVAKAVLYLLDEEVLRERLVKVLWLDVHGNCVWDNKISPDMMLAFTGHLVRWTTLAEFVGESTDPRMFGRGAQLVF